MIVRFAPMKFELATHASQIQTVTSEASGSTSSGTTDTRDSSAFLGFRAERMELN